THLLTALQCVGLPGLVEGHHHDRGAVAPHDRGAAQELRLAVLEGDAVDHAAPLQAAQPGLQDLPAGGVDHHRHPGDVRLPGDQVEEVGHRGDPVQHALIQIDVDQLGARLDLLPGDLHTGVPVALGDCLPELRGAGDVGALTDVD